MRIVYRVLAALVCVGVAFQAAVVVWSVAGLGLYIENGGVLDGATFASDAPPFPEAAGLEMHAMGGLLAIPIIALLLLISSLFAKVPHGRVTALVVLGLVVLQVLLGMLGHAVSLIGALHGVNALLLFGAALLAFRFAGSTLAGPVQPSAARREKVSKVGAQA